MQESHDQQACPSDSVQGSQIRAAGAGHVGEQDNDRRKELKQCAMDACHIFDEFIEQDDRGVEDGSSQTEEDTGKCLVYNKNTQNCRGDSPKLQREIPQ